MRLFGVVLVVSLLPHVLLRTTRQGDDRRARESVLDGVLDGAPPSSRRRRRGARARRSGRRPPPLRAPSPSSAAPRHAQDARGLHALEFVHIPKTGGTSIEIAASRVGIAWGICKFTKFRSGQPQCDHLRPFRHQIQLQRNSEWECRTPASPWHCPPSKFAAGNKFARVRTFAVVRDPYERMISEYYYFFKSQGKRNYRNVVTGKRDFTGDLNDPRFMNRWIDMAVQAAAAQGHCYNGHCVPFYDFVYAPDGTRVVSHVLKMESLREEFEALMDRYQMPVALEQHNVRKGNSTLGVRDLSADTIAKINEWSRRDFEVFGYDMLDPRTKEVMTA